MKAFRFLCAASLLSIVLFLSSCHRKTVPESSNPPASTAGKPAVNNNEVDVSNMENDILSYVNKHRRSKGLPELQMLSVASAEAAKHSANMAARRVAFGHTGFESRVSAISKSLGSISAAAENVADGKLTAQQVVEGWLHSAGHKKNIEGKYTLTGIGIAKDPGGVIYFTQIFVRKLSSNLHRETRMINPESSIVNEGFTARFIHSVRFAIDDSPFTFPVRILQSWWKLLLMTTDTCRSSGC